MYKKITKRELHLLIAGICVAAIALICITVNAIYLMKEHTANATVELQKEVDSYKQELSQIDDNYASQISDLQAIISEKDTRYEDTIESFSNEESVKLELVQKYSYLVQKVDPSGGFTLGMIYYTDEICKELDINPHMIFAIFDIESDYDVNAKSSRSSAQGLGQILSSTAKSIYEGYMGNPSGSYTHDMSLDGYTNIEIVANYIKYLKDHYSSVKVMINGYSGDQSGTYYEWYVAQMKANGQDPTINKYV